MLPILKPIGFAAFWSCGSRLVALRPWQDWEASLPFALLGLGSDNGGQFINHHVVAWTGQRPRPIL